MASFATAVQFTAVSTGTGDFVVSALVAGAQTPASAQAIDGQIYKYRAQSIDLSLWEEGYGVYTVSSVTLARTTVLYNSSGTQAKISFTAAPQVSMVATAEDLLPVDGSIFGLTLSTAGASATFTTATGWAADSTNVNVLRLYSSLAKTTSSWAVGASGSLDTGAIANSTWYHVYIIKRLDTGVVDILTSLSATSPTMPTNYTLKRRIGAMKTDGSAKWTKFYQTGDEFIWDSPPKDVDVSAALGTTAVLYVLSVPTGIAMTAKIRFNVYHATTVAVCITISNPSQTGSATNAGTGANTSGMVQTTATRIASETSVLTDTSAQVQAVSSATSSYLLISTSGWTDMRGRFG